MSDCFIEAELAQRIAAIDYWNKILDRRSFLTWLASVPLVSCPFARAVADDAGGDGGGGNSGKGGGDGGGGKSGKGGGDNDSRGADNDDDDDSERDDGPENARKAVAQGRAVPLRELLKIVNRKHPGEIVDVKLRVRGENYIYRVKIIDRSGRIFSVGIDAVTKRIIELKKP